MPYNNSPIGPSEEITGTSKLPITRIKNIIAQDDEVAAVTKGATFAISKATEIFIRYLTEQAYTVVKSEKKPRRNLAYKDVATAVSRIDNLEFLSDTVPKTKTYRQFREEKARDEAIAAEKAAAVRVNGTNGESYSKTIDQMLRRDEDDEDTEPNGTAGDAPHGATAHASSNAHAAGAVLQNGHSRSATDQDIDMTG